MIAESMLRKLCGDHHLAVHLKLYAYHLPPSTYYPTPCTLHAPPSAITVSLESEIFLHRSSPPLSTAHFSTLHSPLPLPTLHSLPPTLRPPPAMPRRATTLCDPCLSERRLGGTLRKYRHTPGTLGEQRHTPAHPALFAAPLQPQRAFPPCRPAVRHL